MILIGVTGVVGSGKTTVSGMLKRAGLEVLDLDEIAKEITGLEEVKKEIGGALGDAYVKGGALDAQRTAELVFRDRAALARLENIIHPRIRAEICRRTEALRARGIKAVAVDGPLIFEKGLDKDLDKIVVVSASAAKIKERLEKRGMQEEDVKRRTANQMPLKEKEARADHVVHNNGTMEALKKEVNNLLDRIKRWEGALNAS